jgi:hypothetical protein
MLGLRRAVVLMQVKNKKGARENFCHSAGTSGMNSGPLSRCGLAGQSRQPPSSRRLSPNTRASHGWSSVALKLSLTPFFVSGQLDFAAAFCSPGHDALVDRPGVPWTVNTMPAGRRATRN